MARKRKPANRTYQVKAKRAGPTPARNANGTFSKGQSGNPFGRPKEYRDFVDLARQMGSPKAFETLVRDMESGDPRAEVQAAMGMLAYAWGKPKQAIEHSGPDGGPIQTAAAMPLDGLTDEDLVKLKEIAVRAATAAASRAADVLAPNPA